MVYPTNSKLFIPSLSIFIFSLLDKLHDVRFEDLESFMQIEYTASVQLHYFEYMTHLKNNVKSDLQQEVLDEGLGIAPFHTAALELLYISDINRKTWSAIYDSLCGVSKFSLLFACSDLTPVIM